MTDPAVTLRDLTVAFHLADGATYTAVERASLSVADRLREVDLAQRGGRLACACGG
jgi:hypothetical protein